MNKLQMFDKAVEEVEKKARLITAMPDADSINCEYHKAFGYLFSLRDLEVFDKEQYNVAVDLLDAALHAAIKNVPSGATNTEKDKANVSNQSVSQNTEDVKEKAFIRVFVAENDSCQTEIRGSAVDVAASIAMIIGEAGTSGLPKRLLLSAIGAVLNAVGTGVLK